MPDPTEHISFPQSRWPDEGGEWEGDGWLDDDEPLSCGIENPEVCESCQ